MGKQQLGRLHYQHEIKGCEVVNTLWIMALTVAVCDLWILSPVTLFVRLFVRLSVDKLSVVIKLFCINNSKSALTLVLC